MIDQRSINPDDPTQARVFYDMYKSHIAGEKRHPEVVMEELAKQHDFTILDSIPQSLFDGWDVWIESPDMATLELPDLFRKNIPWKPVGQA
jgi:hypothetical protein